MPGSRAAPEATAAAERAPATDAVPPELPPVPLSEPLPPESLPRQPLPRQRLLRDSLVSERYVLALDQGTTSSRAIAFDRTGHPVALAQREFPQGYPFPGHVTHDAEDIWASQLAVAKEAIAQLPGGVASVAALGVTNQRETTVVWERATGRPVAPAIVWQSRITADRCARLRAAGHEPRVRARTGLPLDAYFSGPKIAHILDAEPGLRVRAEAGELCFGTVDSFLAWRLSGGRTHLTDVSNASRTLLFDIARGCWDAWLCDLIGVPMATPPEVRPSSALLGRDGRGGAGRPAAHRGHRRRPDGGHVRAGLPVGRQRQEHLRHGCLRPPQHRPSGGPVRAWPPHHGPLAAGRGRSPGLRPGGRGLRGRGRGSLAARRPARHRALLGRGGPGRSRRPRVGRRRRACLRGAGRPALGPGRPWRDRGPDARLAPRGHRPGHRRRHGLPGRRRARRHGSATPAHRARGAPGGRRRGRQR